MKALANDVIPNDMNGDKLGVGTLAIIVSINQKTDDMYEDKQASIKSGTWKERPTHSTNDGGIKPTHEFEVRITDEEVNKNRQSKHKRHHEQMKFGKKAWAKFIFHYRSRMAIEQAGCIPRPDKSHELGAVGAPTKAIAAKNDVKSKQGNQAEVQTDEVEKEESPQGGNSMFVTPPPPERKKQKLFGQSLSFSKKTPDATGSVADENALNGSNGGNGLDFMGSLANYYQAAAGEARPSTKTTTLPSHQSSHQNEDVPMAMEDDDLAGWLAETEKYLGNAKGDDSSAVLAAPETAKKTVEMRQPDQSQSETTPAVHQTQVQVKDEPASSPPPHEAFTAYLPKYAAAEEPEHLNALQESTTSPVTSRINHMMSQAATSIEARPPNSRSTRPTSALKEIIAIIPSNGISKARLLGYLELRNINHDLAGEVAVLRGDKYFIKDSITTPDALSTFDHQRPTQVNAAWQPKTNTTADQTITIEATSAATTPQSEITPHTPQTSDTSKKRPGSLSLSREGTPTTKKPRTMSRRMAALAAQRAKLLAQHEEKKRWNEAARVELEEEQRAARAEEEAMMREIEELERMNKEEDEEMAMLVRAREGEDEG